MESRMIKVQDKIVFLLSFITFSSKISKQLVQLIYDILDKCILSIVEYGRLKSS